MAAEGVGAMKGAEKKDEDKCSWNGKDGGGGSKFTSLPSMLIAQLGRM